MPNLPGACNECDYYKPRVKDEGTCLRYPPQVSLSRAGYPLTHWPKVEADEGCGEFKQPKLNALYREIEHALESFGQPTLVWLGLFCESIQPCFRQATAQEYYLP